MYKLAASVPAAEEKTCFIDTAVRTVERFADETYRVKTRNFRAVALLKKKVLQSELVL